MAESNHINTFHEGLAMDMAKDVTKNSVITDARNAVIIPRGGESFELQNMKGNELAAFLPEGYFPKDIKVFNGIAYIVSNKYNEDGSYEYTEIGTYPSPNWSALFPEKMEDVGFDMSSLIYEDLSGEENFAITEGVNTIDEFQHVYSFSVPSFTGDIHNVVAYGGRDDTDLNLFDITIRNWSYLSRPIAPDYPSPAGINDYGRIKYAYLKFKVFDKDGTDCTLDLKDNMTIDILRVDVTTPNGEINVNVGSNSFNGLSHDAAILTNLRIVENSDHVTVLYKYNSLGVDRPSSYGSDLMYPLSMRRYSQDSNAFPPSTFFNWSYPGGTSPFFGDHGSGRVLDVIPYELIFLVKVDSEVKKELHFETGISFTYGESGNTVFSGSIILNTKTGMYFKEGSPYNPAFVNAQSYWVNKMNAWYSTVQKQKSKIIYGRQKMRISDMVDGCNCSFYGDIGTKKQYVGLKPLISNKKTFGTDGTSTVTYANAITDDLLIGYEYYWLDNRYLYNAAFNLSTSFVSQYIQTEGVERVSSIKVQRSDRCDFKSTCGDFSVGMDFKKGMLNHSDDNLTVFNSSAGAILVFEITEDDWISNREFVISYYNQPYRPDAEVNQAWEHYGQRDTGYVFEKYFNSFETASTVSANNMLTPVLASGNVETVLDLKGTYKYIYILDGVVNPSAEYIRNAIWGGLGVLVHLSYNSIIASSSSPAVNLAIYNGQAYLQDDYVLSNDITANAQELLDYVQIENPATSYTSSISEAGTELTVYNCINEGSSTSIEFELPNDCCEGEKKNLLLHFKINYDFGGTGGNVSFSSIYSYLGAFFKVFYGDDNEIVLLFSGIPNGQAVTLSVVSDLINSELELMIDSMVLEKGYYYCLEQNMSEIEDKYCPIFNFNTDSSINDIYLLDSQNNNFAFRSNIFTKDTDTDYELELQPNYDATINLIINDKTSKVKLINSRFAFNPSNNKCFIPQQYGFNDDNVYSNKFIHGTELIRRTNSILDVNFESTFNGGELNGGSYVYYFRYIDSNGNTSDIINHTLPISVFNLEDNVFDNNGENVNVKTNSAVKIRLSSFDRLYKHIEISFVYNGGELDSLKQYYKIDKLYNIPLSDELIVVHTGLEGLKELSYNDILLKYNHHLSVESITQGKKKLLLSNEKLSDVAIYAEIKRLALNMTITESIDTITDENFFKVSSNITDRTGYWRGETYQIGIALKLIKGGESPVFNPRGIDNFTGNINNSSDYSDSISSLSEFTGPFGENAYGVYRTNNNSSIYNVTGHDTGSLLPSDSETYNIQLVINNLKDFLESPLVKSIAKGYTIYRKHRIKDTLVEGFTVPVFESPFSLGISYKSDGATPPVSSYDDTSEFVEFDPAITHAQGLSIHSTGYDSESKGRFHIAPFGVIQAYVGEGNNEGYPVGDKSNKQELVITNMLIKQDERLDDKFGFVSGDLIADGESFAANFQGKGKFYYVNRNSTNFYNPNATGTDNGLEIESFIINRTNSKVATVLLDSEVKFTEVSMSGDTESQYITEKAITEAPGGFASTLDMTNINFFTSSFIGVTEGNGGTAIPPVIPNILKNNYNNNNPYGFLTRVYTKERGPLSNNDWKTLYASRYQEGGYFPITSTQNINNGLDKVLLSYNSYNTDIDNLSLFGGDCYITKSYFRVLTKNGLDDNFDNYSSIWDYIGGIESREMKDEGWNKDDPASNSWFTDNDYMGLKRSRLIPKGLWAEMVHESNFNLALRTSEFKSTQEKVKYNKDRTYLTSLKKINSYIPTEFGSSQIDSKGYNKGYSIHDGALFNFTLNDVEKLLRIFYSRIEVSDIAIKGALKNGYRELFGLNYKDYDTRFGYISKIASFNDISYVLFETGLGIIPLDEKTQVTGKDGGVFIDNINVLGKDITVISSSNGTIHPDSVAITKSGGYFYDHNKTAIIQFGGQSAPKAISDFKIETFLYEFKAELSVIRESSEGYISYNVKTNYNTINGDIVFTFIVYRSIIETIDGDGCLVLEPTIRPNNDNVEYSEQCNKFYDYFDNSCPEYDGGQEPEDDKRFIGERVDCNEIPTSASSYEILLSKSIYYNEKLGKWISPLTFSPNFIFSLGENTFSMNLLINQNRIYKHNSKNVNYCFFYDEQHNFSFEFVLNKDEHIQKILNNLQIVSNERVPINVSYDVESKRRLGDSFTSTEERVRHDYDLDLVQDIKTRRFEVKIIGLSVNNDFSYYLNTNDPLIHSANVGDIFSINTSDYRISGITSILTDEGLMMPKLDIEYLEGSIWVDLNTIQGSDIYEQVFGYALKITKVNITRSNSDYVEDHMWIQVQLKNTIDGWREIRDRTIKVKINYDGIDKTFIHSIISTVEQSVN